MSLFRPTRPNEGRVILICQALYICAQAGSFALARVLWAADMASFLRAHLLALGMLLAVLGLLSGKKTHILASLATIACAVLPYLSLPVQASASRGAHVNVSIVTANVLGTNRDAVRFFNLPEVKAADLVVLQEVPSTWQEALVTARDTWPWQSEATVKISSHLRILSRFPITSEQVITPPTPGSTGGRNAVRVALMVGSHPVIVYAVHAQTPRSPQMWRQRNTYLENLASVLEQEKPDASVIVAGDWNTPPWSPFLNDFLERTGYQNTEPFMPVATRFVTGLETMPWLGTPIDRIALSPDLGLKAIGTAGPFGSDHLPVSAVISVPQ
ncbi:endonuclease/exonuclease/phosphatase family protein [Paracoccus sp. IB05]|uniref:endonuclease/exonuclease/phosphatase family protein n=1 Tax=Paracoccus sp. IB05 TaxID=2779367 RepID=UPI0018E7BA31|nr:endonuclease/exonuclease/phosphatase family protein [Paracoccus sp. IB05]MBJ2152688.1 endonuclease/exonuclease/phosphatase family protein [Paracoccus sp. IB05]